MDSNKTINVGVIGVGNCFSGLYQGIEYYKTNPDKDVIGVMHQEIGGYKVQDINFVSAFDVASNKVGKKLNIAAKEKPNYVKWHDLPESNVVVQLAPALDGIGDYVRELIDPIITRKQTSTFKNEIVQHLKETNTEILINYLPVGSDQATKFWAEVALEAKVAFVNCMPSFIASVPEWVEKFEDAGIPILGDDIKGQIGATIVHRVLAKLFADRGTDIKDTYQLNVGGNTDFLNMKQASRLTSKRISKTEAVQSQLNTPLDDSNIYVGPSDYVPFLKNKKICFIKIDANLFADIPISLDLKLEVDDKANSSAIVADCIRFARKALDENKSGYQPVSSYYMKHPLEQFSDSEAKKLVLESK